MMNPLIVNNKKMLCYSEHFRLYCRGNTLFAETSEISKRYKIGQMPMSMLKACATKIRLLSRLARLEPRCGIFMNDNTALISFHGTVYRVNLEDNTVTPEHSFRPGMSSPLSFAKLNNLSGFDNCILYGDYINDGKRNIISIHARKTNSPEWSIVYSFSRGAVKHIHALIPCYQRNSVLILTGDSNEESGIWEAFDNFKYVRKIIGGEQKYRACAALPLDHGVIYATDAPDEDNALWYCNYDGGDTKKIADLSGPCIYGVQINGNRMLISTSVEPSSQNIGLSSWITYKRGKGVHDRFSHVYMLNSDLTVSDVYRGHKDILPMRLFGFGTFLFPSGTGNNLYITGQSVKGIDGKTLELVDL